MQYAIVNNDIVEATQSKSKGKCPGCKGEVVARVGSIKIPHWAHLSTACEFQRESETEWHREWKSKFPRKTRERYFVAHRADVCGNGMVLEFQHSTISYVDIHHRNIYYTAEGFTPVWVFDMRSRYSKNQIYPISKIWSEWKWKSKAISSIDNAVVFLQVSDFTLHRVTKWTYKGYYYDNMPIKQFVNNLRANLRFSPKHFPKGFKNEDTKY